MKNHINFSKRSSVNIINSFLFFFFSIILTSVAKAETSGATPQYSACLKKAGGITLNMSNCIDDEMQRQDVKLNNTYKLLLTSLPPKRRDSLKNAQRLWINYRDANCNFYVDPEGGTSADLESRDCLLTMLTARVKELDEIKKAANLR